MFQVFEPRGSATWPRFDSKRAFAKLSSTLDRDEKRFEPSRILYLYLVLKNPITISAQRIALYFHDDIILPTIQLTSRSYA